MNLVRESALYFLPTLCQTLLAPATLFFYSRVLSREDFGVLGLVGVTTGLLSILANWGLVNGMVRFHGEPGQEPPRLLGTAFLGSLAAGSAVWLAAVLLSGPLADLSGGGRPVVILGTSGVVASLAVQSWQNHLRMGRRAAAYARWEITTILGSGSLGILLAWGLGLGLPGAAAGPGLALLAAALLQYLRGVRPEGGRFDPAVFRRLVSYGAPFSVILVGAWALDWSDRYLLRLFVPLADLGIYHVGYGFGMYVQALVNPFVTAVLPHLFRYHREGTYREKAGRMALVYAAVYLGVALLFAFLARPYYLLLTPPHLHPAAAVAPWIALCYAWRGLFNIFCFPNTLSGDARSQFRIEIGAAVLNILLNLILIPRLGIAGAVASTLAAWVFQVGWAWRRNQRVMPIALPGGRMAGVLTAGILSFGCVVTLAGTSLWPVGILPVAAYLAAARLLVPDLGLALRLLRPVRGEE